MQDPAAEAASSSSSDDEPGSLAAVSPAGVGSNAFSTLAHRTALFARSWPASWVLRGLAADSRSPRGGPLAIRQADSQTRSTLGSVDVLLQLGDLLEETLVTVFDLECDADLILGFSWLRDHGLSVFCTPSVSVLRLAALLAGWSASISPRRRALPQGHHLSCASRSCCG